MKRKCNSGCQSDRTTRTVVNGAVSVTKIVAGAYLFTGAMGLLGNAFKK